LDSLTKKGILNRGMARKSIRSPRKKQKYYSINISRRFVMIVSREKEIKQRIPDRSPT